MSQTPHVFMLEASGVGIVVTHLVDESNAVRILAKYGFPAGRIRVSTLPSSGATLLSIQPRRTMYDVDVLMLAETFFNHVEFEKTHEPSRF